MSVMGPNERMLIRSDSTQSLKTEVEKLKQEEKELKERERRERLERLRDEYNFRMGTSVMDRSESGIKRPSPKSFPSHYASPRLVRKPKGQSQMNGAMSPTPAPRMLTEAAKVRSDSGLGLPSPPRRLLTRSISEAPPETKPIAVPTKKSHVGSPSSRSPNSTSGSPGPGRRPRASTQSDVETDLRRVALGRGMGANANTEARPRVNSMPTQNRLQKPKGRTTGSLDNLKKSPRGSDVNLASSKTSSNASKESVSSVEDSMAKLSLSTEAGFPPGIMVDGDHVFFTDGDVDQSADGEAPDADNKPEKRVKKSPIPAQYKGYEYDYQGQFDNVVQSNFNDMLGIHTILSMVSKQ